MVSELIVVMMKKGISRYSNKHSTAINSKRYSKPLMLVGLMFTYFITHRSSAVDINYTIY